MGAAVAYLGPEGTFAQAAALQIRTTSAEQLEPAVDVETIADGVERGTFEFGVVPIENSVHGFVLPTLDHLLFVNERVLVREEVVLDVTFTLWRNAAAPSGAASVVLSHPHALAQCRRAIVARGLRTEETPSTADACRLVAQERTDALCIAGPLAGDRYGLVAEAVGVEDRTGGRTRFYLLATRLAPAPSPAAVTDFRTALVLTPVRDRPGILLEMLRPFAERGVNMSSLMSRPLRSALGIYCFFVIVDTHIDDPRLAAAVSDLLDAGVRVKNLGSYLAWPSAPPLANAHADVPPGSVASNDPPDRQARALAPPHDEG
jgi:prephenate dehydratase